MPVKVSKVSKEASKEILVAGDDIINIKDLALNQKTRSLEGHTWDTRVSLSKSSATTVDASVTKYAGKCEDGKVVSTAECIKPGYVVYAPLSEHPHAFPENIKAFPVLVRIKENGELKFSVVPADKTQDIMAVHNKMKADLHMHGVEIDREGFLDMKGVRKLSDLFGKSLSSDPEVRKQGVDLTKWELGITDLKETIKRMRVSVEVILHDQSGIGEAVRTAEQAFEVADNPEVRKRIPEPLPLFHKAGKLR